MKSSRYNHFVTMENGTTLAYNCLTGALAEVGADDYARIRMILDHPDRPGSGNDHQLAESLIEGGYLVPDGIDEMAELEAESRIRRRQHGILTLTIAPTLTCNFCCDYCFISQAPTRMDDRTERALIKFVESRLEDMVRMRVSWFGGEPTICFPTIERVQKELNELAASRQIEIGPISMVSNGYLLDHNMARRLKALGFSKVQITLDGPEEVHDARRKLHDGRGTFRRILDNLAEIVDLLNIHVRINIDKRNLESAVEVLQILEARGILTKVTVSFAQVQAAEAVCASIRDRCFCEDEFSRCLVDLHQLLIDRGIYRVDYPRTLGAVLCGALTENSFAVSPTGHLFRCRDGLSADSEKSIGDIFGNPPGPAQKRNLEKFREWNPFEFEECRQCNILPICMAGCPLYTRIEPGMTKGTCSPWKYNLEKMLQLKYRCEIEKQVKP